jgi:hypothetical protein
MKSSMLKLIVYFSVIQENGCISNIYTKYEIWGQISLCSKLL